MSKLVFVQQIWHDLVGTMSVAAYVKEHGHECDLVIEAGEKDLLAALEEENADLIGFSCLASNFLWVLQTAARIKERLDVPVVVGGIHATSCPELIIEHDSIDYVCVGEGEGACRDLLDRLEEGRGAADVANIWSRSNGEVHRNPSRALIEPLDSLPRPDRSLYMKYDYFKQQKMWTIMTGRGCPYPCTYCHNHLEVRFYRGNGKWVRQHSVDRAISEIKELKEKLPVEEFMFADDVLWLRKAWVTEFLERYRDEIGVPYFCTITPHVVDEELIKLLKESGCSSTAIAFDHGNEQVRIQTMRKNVKDEHYIQVAQWLHKHELPFATTSMYGIPGETYEQALDNIRFNHKLKPTSIPWASIFVPYPKTDLANRALEEGCISETDFDRISDSFYARSMLRQKDIGRITNLHRFHYWAVRYPVLFPIVKQLAKLPSNKLFDMAFLASYVWYLKTKRKCSWGNILKQALVLAKGHLARKRSSAHLGSLYDGRFQSASDVVTGSVSSETS